MTVTPKSMKAAVQALYDACVAVNETMVECPKCHGSCTDPQDHKGQIRCGACRGLGEVMDDDCADEVNGAITMVRAALRKAGNDDA